MTKRVKVKSFGGRVRAISSKSYMHRASIAAALSEGESTLLHTDLCRDSEATLLSLSALGARTEKLEGGTRVHGMRLDGRSIEEALICRESASTLRFLIPLLALFGGGRMACEGRLLDRPFAPIANALAPHGITLRREGDFLCVAGAKLASGTFHLTPTLSSQFTSGLLFALPVLAGDSCIHIEGREVSRPYIAMTREVQAAFGFRSEEREDGYFIPGNQRGCARTYEIEGDFSNAAFFLTAGAIGSECVTVTHLKENSLQGDAAVLSLLESFGAKVSFENGSATVYPSDLRGTDIDAADVPDLVPVLSVAAAASVGDTRFFNVSRLREKESDRLLAVIRMLDAFGVSAESDGQILTVHGTGRLTGGCVDSFGDHRLAMSAAVGAVRATGAVDILFAECVQKSYPAFFEDYASLACLDGE